MATIEGLKVLEGGGNAFDAAIKISSILTLALPNTSSIGGDGFLLAMDRDSNIIAYNGSGKSPRNMQVEEYLTQSPVRGPLTVTVPGLVDLWDWTNNKYGSMSLFSLLNTSISLASNGYFVQEPLSQAIAANHPILDRYKSWVNTFGWMKTGSYIRFPNLAKIYTAIAAKGRDAFYRDQSTERMVQELNKQGVPLTYQDFAEHEGIEVVPIKCNYGEMELNELPPNTQGLTTLQILKAVETLGFNKLPFENSERIKEFFKIAIASYQDRERYLADCDYFNASINNLLSPSYLSERWLASSNGQGTLNPNDTTFFVVADRYGNLVAFIQSVFHNFGSGIVVYDVPFQSRGAGFAKKIGVPNAPCPGKRPLHTLSILLARSENKGDFFIGCTGGDLRPQIHAEVLMNIIDYDMALSKAVEAPRYILTSWLNKDTSAIIEENVWTPDLPHWAERIGYQSPKTGIVQAMRRRQDGLLEFVADSRGGGAAASIF